MTAMISDQQETHYLGQLIAAGVPEHLHGGLVRYLVHRLQPGHFLTAVLENDLREAMGRADEQSRAGLFQIVKFLYNDAPSICWGSPERVQQWLAERAT
jgi:hypothetical protein